MNEPTPSKPLRTRIGIVDALAELLGDTSIDRVTVSTLCQQAGISRTTFYQYFDNITGVGIWMWDHVMDQTLYQVGIKYSAYEGHLKKFQALRESRYFFKELLKHTEYDSVMQHAGRYMLTHFVETIARHRGTPLDEFEVVRMRLFVVGAKHMTRDWAEEGMREEPELMTDVFIDSLPAFALPWLEPDDTYPPERRLDARA